MGILNGARRLVGDLAGEASKQAAIIQLQTERDSLLSRLEETYARAGRRAEVMHRGRRFEDPELVDAFKLVETLTARIVQLEEEMRASREDRDPNVICPGCQKVLDRGVRFCPVCGTQIRICPQCHAVVKPDERFCPGCGTKIADQPGAAQVDPPPSAPSS